MSPSQPGAYEAAFAAAQALANQLGREVGIEKANEFGRTVYLVKHLPKPENRCGWELRCEVVQPVVGISQPDPADFGDTPDHQQEASK